MGQRRIVLLLGMHRSGTSAATRALSLCGMRLPSDLLEASPENPDGYWEKRGVVLLHDAVLQAMDLNWRSTRRLPQSWFATAQASQFRDRLWQAIEPDLAEAEPLLVKDPRLCRLVPLWRRLAADHALPLHCVLVVRNPLEVAASLARRDAMPLAEALLLWLRHVIEAERATRGLVRGVMLHEQLMREGPTAVRRVAGQAAIALPPATIEDNAAVAGCLNPGHWHHRSDRAALAADALVPDWVTTAYDWLRQAAEGDEPAAGALDAIHAGMQAADLLYTPPESQAAERVELQQQLAAAEAVARSFEARLAVEQASTLAGRAELDGLTAELDRLRTDLNHRGVELDRRATELAQSRRETDALRGRFASLLRDHQVLAATAAALRASRSWRLTAPLRFIGRMVRH